MATDAGAAVTWWAVASAFGGAIIGAVLGGAVSYFLQKKSLAATKALHDADRLEVRKALGQPLIGVISAAAAHRPAATLSNVKGKREAPSLPANVTCSHSSQTNLSEPAMWVSGISWAQSCKC
jgi:hypothetical protein